jgi:hypothetical protein
VLSLSYRAAAVKAAVAASKGASFLSLSSGDVYSPYVGDAEAAVRRAFATARQVLYTTSTDSSSCRVGLSCTPTVAMTHARHPYLSGSSHVSMAGGAVRALFR